MFAHHEEVNCTIFSKDGKLIISGGKDKYIRIWEYNTDVKILLRNEIIAHEGSVNTIAINNNGNIVISGGDDCYINVWDLINF